MEREYFMLVENICSLGSSQSEEPRGLSSQWTVLLEKGFCPWLLGDRARFPAVTHLPDSSPKRCSLPLGGGCPGLV